MPTRWIALMMAAALMTAATSVARAEIVVTIDKSSQRMTVSRDGQQLYNWPVSTGAPGYSTPSGNFTAFRMEADHFSKEWDDAPMPHSIFFTQIGHAIHGTGHTKNLGSPASHGCVRLSPENAATLYAMVEQEGVTKMKVHLTGDEKIALARRGTTTVQNEQQQRSAPPGYDSREAAGDPWGGRTNYRAVDPRYAADPRYADPRGYPPYPGQQYYGAPRDDGYDRRYPPQYFESYRYQRRFDTDD